MDQETNPRPEGEQWKDWHFVEQWRKKQVQKFESKWKARGLTPREFAQTVFRPTPRDLAAEAVQLENETMSERADRLEPGRRKKKGKTADQARHQCPTLIARIDGKIGQWIISPIAQLAKKAKMIKAQKMYDDRLEKKAQREIACGLLGGEIHCRNNHQFFAAYRCGNRYCSNCAPIDGMKLFARQHDRILFVATRLMLCGKDDCSECSAAINEKRIPHWPPDPKVKPKIVCAKIDFTLRHDRRDGLPTPERMKELNRLIKKFCRLLEKRFKITRKEYGLAYCDELGGNNSNPHAHGVYVGPWLPQSKERKELSELWREVTGGDSFILSIKFARNFSEGLFHAIKYPAKFAERSSPERLADLEKVFHRVRRFHTLAAFYNPEVPPREKPVAGKCPICDEPLTEPRGWLGIAQLERAGLRDVDQIRKECRKFVRDYIPLIAGIAAAVGAPM